MRYLSLVLLLCVACGRGAGEDLGDPNNNGGRDGSTIDKRPTNRDGAVIMTCTPSEVFCRGSEIVQCNNAGNVDTSPPIETCLDTILDACRFCPGDSLPSCAASVPLATGSVIGISPRPIELRVDGCTNDTIALRWVDGPAAKAFQLNVAQASAFRVAAWTYNGSTGRSITSGVTFPLNEGGNPRMAITIGNCQNEFGAYPAPSSGTARVTWESTLVSTAVHFEAEGPVSCDGGASWQDMKLDIHATITE